MPSIFPILILLMVSYWVFNDAKARGMNASAWAIFVFLLLIIGFPAYMIMRKPRL